jgi:DNA helicase MCM8
VLPFFHSLHFGPWCFLQYKFPGEGFQLNDIEKVNIRLYNHTETIIALKNLKAAYISMNLCLSFYFVCPSTSKWSTDLLIYLTEKLVTVRGTVVKVSTVKPLVLELDFQCMKCATTIRRVFSDGKFSPPVSCIIQGCKGRTFTPMRSTAKLIDFQKIRQVINRSSAPFSIYSTKLWFLIFIQDPGAC